MKKYSFKLTYLAFYFMFIGILSGCASKSLNDSQQSCRMPIVYAPDVKSETIWTDRKLEDTFCRYWNLRFEGKISQTYAMEAPQFREQFTIDQYANYVKRTKENILKKMTIKGAGKDKNSITYLDYDLVIIARKNKEMSSSIRDKWIQVDGNWFHAIRDPFFFPITYK